MLSFAVRRLLLAVPTLLGIALVIFLLLNLAPNDPMAQVPMTVPPEVKQRMREALGLGEALHLQFWKWLVQLFWIEPRLLIDWLTRDSALLGWLPDSTLYQGELRMLSWQSRAPVMEIVLQRLPQTLWVVGSAYLLAVVIALPVGIYSAYRPYSCFDQAGTLLSMLGYSIPPVFSGVLVILIFSVQLGWFPSIYDTTHRVTDWPSLRVQIAQMVLPVMVLTLQITAQLSRFMRAAMRDALRQDYVRSARAKGLSEPAVVLGHVLRNAMIPVVTVIALGVPQVFGGAIITEQLFKVNGIGQLLITAIAANDLPMVQTLTFVFAALIVIFNLLADLAYGLLDPRIRYD